jgi:hypothetical protein
MVGVRGEGGRLYALLDVFFSCLLLVRTTVIRWVVLEEQPAILFLNIKKIISPDSLKTRICKGHGSEKNFRTPSFVFVFGDFQNPSQTQGD